MKCWNRFGLDWPTFTSILTAVQIFCTNVHVYTLSEPRLSIIQKSYLMLQTKLYDKAFQVTTPLNDSISIIQKSYLMLQTKLHDKAFQVTSLKLFSIEVQ